MSRSAKFPRYKIMSTISTYIGGHKFEVEAEYTPEINQTADEPFEDEELEITAIFLGDSNVTKLLVEEACDLFDRIYAQAMTRIKEGDL